MEIEEHDCGDNTGIIDIFVKKIYHIRYSSFFRILSLAPIPVEVPSLVPDEADPPHSKYSESHR
jgi:hypothetical protein